MNKLRAIYLSQAFHVPKFESHSMKQLTAFLCHNRQWDCGEKETSRLHWCSHSITSAVEKHYSQKMLLNCSHTNCPLGLGGVSLASSPAGPSKEVGRLPPERGRGPHNHPSYSSLGEENILGNKTGSTPSPPAVKIRLMVLSRTSALSVLYLPVLLCRQASWATVSENLHNTHRTWGFPNVTETCVKMKSYV